MKRFAFIFFILYSCLSFGQYSNDWINHSQQYYRIPITTEGIYRVTYSDLVNNGIMPGEFDHRNVQIYHNGKVLPLFVPHKVMVFFEVPTILNSMQKEETPVGLILRFIIQVSS